MQPTKSPELPDPFAHLRPWRIEARRALDSWAPSPELCVAEALERAFERGVQFAAGVLEKENHPDLARTVRAAARTKTP